MLMVLGKSPYLAQMSHLATKLTLKRTKRIFSKQKVSVGSGLAIKASLMKMAFLSLTGRLKEIINRGGEKISPLEVDGILSDHPAVGQCVTFAVPHAKLGEDVGAAVVLKEG